MHNKYRTINTFNDKYVCSHLASHIPNVRSTRKHVAVVRCFYKILNAPGVDSAYMGQFLQVSKNIDDPDLRLRICSYSLLQQSQQVNVALHKLKLLNYVCTVNLLLFL